MKKLDCSNCGVCCKWMKANKDVRPKLTNFEAEYWGYETTNEGIKVMKAKEDGSCHLLSEDGKCTIHEHKHFPKDCAKFDCRELYKRVSENNLIVMLTLVEGLRRIQDEEKDSNSIVIDDNGINDYS